MKSFQWTIIGAIMVAALVAFTVYDGKRAEKEKAAKNESTKLISLDQSDLSAFEIVAHPAEPQASKLRLERGNDKSNDGWIIVSPVQDRADQDFVTTYLSGLSSERSTTVVAEGADAADSHLSAYGLDHPTFELRLFDKKSPNTVAGSVKIGSVRALDGSLYALTSGKVFLVSNQWDSQLSKLAVEFRDKKVFRGTWHAHEIHLRVSEGEHAGDLTLTRVGEQWQVKNALFPISNSAVDQYLTMLENFRVVSYHDELSTDAHVLKERQLDQPLLTLTAANDKNRFELRIAAGQAKGKLTRSSEFDENERSVLSSDVNVIGTVFKTSITSLEKSLEDFYDKQKSFTFNSDDSAAIVVRSSSPAYDVHLEKKSGAWVDAKGAPATTVVASFLTKLKALQVGHFFDAKEMAQSKSRSSLELRCDRDCVEIKNTKGEVVFALNWQMPSGKAKESTSDKAKSNGAWVVAKTNLTRPVFGLSEPAISALLAILSEQKMAK